MKAITPDTPAHECPVLFLEGHCPAEQF